jgi:hypothetical protein
MPNRTKYPQLPKGNPNEYEQIRARLGRILDFYGYRLKDVLKKKDPKTLELGSNPSALSDFPISHKTIFTLTENRQSLVVGKKFATIKAYLEKYKDVPNE